MSYEKSDEFDEWGFPVGNGGQARLSTAAACGVTEIQQATTAALQKRQTLHSPQGNLLI